MKTFILGGVKSGKSAYAEQLALETRHALDQPVTYVATASLNGNHIDDEMRQRIQRHQQDRAQDPEKSDWPTIECGIALNEYLPTIPEQTIILIDCFTLWITELLHQAPESLDDELARFTHWLENSPHNVIMVSNESGLGITPINALSRSYLDSIGQFHQAIAKRSDQVAMMVAGLPLWLKRSVVERDT